MYLYGDLRDKVKSLGSIIDAPKDLFPDFGQQNQYAHPYIEIRFPFYYLVVSENGREVNREKFLSVDGLLYSIFEKITFEMAMQYEVSHRIPNQDSRRILFSYQLKLMQKLSCKWENRLRNHIMNIVDQNPYQD